MARQRPIREVAVLIQLRTDMSHQEIKRYLKDCISLEGRMDTLEQIQCNDMGVDKPRASGKKRAQ